MSISSPTRNASAGFGQTRGARAGAPSRGGGRSRGGERDGGSEHRGSPLRANAALRAVKRHAVFVRQLRRFFAVCMGVQIALVLGFSLVNSLRTDVALAYEGVEGENIRIERPVFDGKDAHNSRYQIVSDAVVRRPDDLDRSLLENPVMTVYSDGEATFTLSASEGEYNQANQTLALTGDIRLVSLSGYNFSTEEATLYLRSGIAEGNLPISGVGPMGSISAQSFRLDQNERWISFGRGVEHQVEGTILQDPTLALRD